MRTENQLGEHIQEWLILRKVYIFFLVVFGGYSLIAADNMYVYPGLPGNLYLSTRYVVSVSQSGNSYDSYVYNSVNTCTDANHVNMTNDNNFTSFSFDGSVVVTVTLPLKTTSITAVDVLPSSKGITATWVGKTITIPISTAGNYYVRINGEEKNPLFIFANPLEINPPASSSNTNTLYLTPSTYFKNFASTKAIWYFGPGLYDVDLSGGTLQNIPSGKTIYLAGGAFVKGLIKASSNCASLTIRGRGILSGEDGIHVPDLWDNFLVDGSSTTLNIEGIIVTDAPQANMVSYVSGSVFDNVKVLGWHMNNDSFDHGPKSTVKNCFIKTNDDGLKPGISGSNYKDNVIWIQSAGDAIQLGWNQTVDMPGSNIMVDGLDIIGNDNLTYNAMDAPCVVALRNVCGATYSGVTIQNIRSDVEVTRLFALAIKGTYGTYVQGLGTVNGITFKNFDFPLGQRNKGVFDGNGTQPGEIKNVNFDCVTIGTTLVTSANASTYFTQQGKTSGFTYTNSCNTSASENFDLEMNGFSIFPNPANDSVTIKLFGNGGNQQMQIFNSNGELMKEFEITQSAKINIADFVKGIYFIQLKNYPQQTQKFIK